MKSSLLFFRSAGSLGLPTFLCLTLCLAVAGTCLGDAADETPAEKLATEEQQAIAQAVEKVRGSLVRIETLGGLETLGKDSLASGPTTGVVVGEDGYVITSSLNFGTTPTSILVTLPSGARTTAQVVARDYSRMLVLLKVKTTEKLTVPAAVPRADLRVGQWALALGRTFEGDQPSLSLGVISAKARVWGRAIQTDAKISPQNYGGPLVDLHGRVLGILTPISPQGQMEDQSGTEWYDAGIGFAIPLTEIQAQLEKLKSGKDLYPGVMGLSLRKGNIFSLSAEILGCRIDGPAARAGLKAKDVIVEMDGQPITRQAQMKHAIGPKYGGEKVKVVAKSGEQTISVELELVDKLAEFDHAFLGILPLRLGNPQQPGVAIRFVYADSPAAKEGILAGDVIVQCGGQGVTSIAGLYQQIVSHNQQQPLALELMRGEQKISVKVKLGRLPTAVPAELPTSNAAEPPAANPPPETGVMEVAVPLETRVAKLLIPKNYHPAVPQGLMIWFSSTGEVTPEQLTEKFGALAEKHQFLVLAPPAAEKGKWLPSDGELVVKLLEKLKTQYTLDEARVVTYGFQQGGSMAFLYGMSHLEQVRGVVLADTTALKGNPSAGSDQSDRLAFFVLAAKETPAEKTLGAMAKKLESLHLPLTQKVHSGAARDFSEEELAEVARWLDTLDRL